jgi:hypothetical protein
MNVAFCLALMICAEKLRDELLKALAVSKAALEECATARARSPGSQGPARLLESIGHQAETDFTASVR